MKYLLAILILLTLVSCYEDNRKADIMVNEPPVVEELTVPEYEYDFKFNELYTSCPECGNADYTFKSFISATIDLITDMAGEWVQPIYQHGIMIRMGGVLTRFEFCCTECGNIEELELVEHKGYSGWISFGDYDERTYSELEHWGLCCETP